MNLPSPAPSLPEQTEAQDSQSSQHSHYYYLPLKITLLQEVVLTASAASGAQHTSLPYLPGANLLGAFAAQFYRSIGEECGKEFGAELGAEFGAKAQRWLFHSGALSFGDAHVICTQDGKMAKADNLTSSGLQIAQALPLSHGLPPGSIWKNGQPVKLCRREARLRAAPVAEYLASGHLLQIPMRYRVKSAREPQSGAAADGLLFAYQAMPAGMSLYAELRVGLGTELSTEISNNAQKNWQAVCLQKISAKLKAQGMRLQLGKSRSAEYGGAQLQCLGDWQKMHFTPTELPEWSEKAEFDLLLLADLALEADGMPSLQAHAENFAWPKAEWLAAASFFKTRRYSPYHGHYRSQDSERLVFTRGSVLRYRLTEKPDAATWRKMAAQAWLGLGRYTEAGLGRACLWPCSDTSTPIPNPTQNRLSKWLNQPGPQAVSANPTETQEADALFDWLQASVKSSEAKSVDSSKFIADLQNLYAAGKRIDGLGKDEAWGPGRAQWGRLRTCAANWQSLQTMLLSEIKKEGSPWKKTVLGAANQAGSCLAWVWQILGFVVTTEIGELTIKTAREPSPEKLELLRRLAYEAQQSQVRGSKT